MLYIIFKDVEKKLDMTLGMSLPFKHDILTLIGKDVETMPASMYRADGSSYVDLLVRSGDVLRMMGILVRFKPIRVGDYLIIRLSGEEIIGISQLAGRIMDFPSAIPGQLYVKGERIYFWVRFHHSDLPAISSFLQEITASGNDARLEDLGPSAGGINDLDEINSRIRLSVISFEYRRKYDFPKEQMFEHYGEINSKLLESDKYRVVMYPAEASMWKDYKDVISREDGIYVTHGRGPLLTDIFRKLNDLRIPTAATMGLTSGLMLRIFQFTPLAFVDESLKVIFESARSYPDIDFRLIAVRNYSRSIWDWV